MTDEEIIREALENAISREYHPIGEVGEIVTPADTINRQALAALDRLKSRCLPELREAWFYTAMYQTDVVDPKLDGWLIEIGKGERRSTGEGPTPRAALENALAKIATPTGKDSQ